MGDKILKLGDQGPAVAEAQDLLNRDGALLLDDGKFGAGTAAAVREFRAARKLPDSGDIDAALWAQLRLLPLPNASIPTRAVAFIAREEVSSRSYYAQFCARPSWPGGASGVTLGVGYDLGYQADFERDWSDQFSAAQIARLKKWVGIKGAPAKAAIAPLADVSVPWHAAWEGYVRRTLPQEVKSTVSTFVVPPATAALPPLCLGVLVSLVYNRGAGMIDNSPNDPRKEMRQIRDAVAQGKFAQVPDAIRSMRRLWPAGNGLRARREREAELFEVGLAQAQ